ncbi:P-loop containing nucleoside triphosphate hydrolase protein [Zopfia rhizophila CBS 207.26]|uniref:P-loop containing nucleoside triphosphate hydrolase protein n=1 Tax=Zopfia rhizophila CBS 207.26 TaxID=1314779 RepID=A0A6A6EAJ6_9PEZI|nr:P-loop containing nucleoside triphosphate hydrolase protein [Zopfia rhizophila CBS 207.26]
MALLWHQIRTLTFKNLLITLYRHWLSTPLRALILPLLFVLFLSYTRNFLSPSSQFGIGELHPIRSLPQVIGAASGGRDRIVFVTGGFTEGDIERVIGDVASTLRDSGINTLTLQREEELRTACVSTVRGTSRCIAAAVFYSSPTEGDGGLWNYTIRADGGLGTSIHVDTDENDAQIYTLPLQHAIDFAVSRFTSTANSEALSRTVYEYPFTSKTHEQRQDDIRVRYMDMIISVLAAPFYLSVAGVIYQMTGFIATEREIGMAQLLDTMMPNRARWQPQVARIISHHLAFDLLYGPGWIVTGALLGAMSFRNTSIVIPIAFNLLAGLSTTSLAVFAGGFFRKAQLSGITAIIVSLVLAIIAQVSAKAGTGVVAVLSFLFPPMNYVYFLVLIARWESESRPLNLFQPTQNSPFTLPAIVFYVFMVIQTIAYPILGALVERRLYGTASSSRRTVVSESPIAVNLNGFTKEYKPEFMKRALRFWTKRPFDSVLAVKNLNLQAYRGEILVLLGANGSGKSTTLDAVAGLHSISGGEISIHYPDAQGSFGYCPQNNVLWDDVTVSEHVKIFDGIKCIGKRASRAEIKSLIESCDLAKKTGGLSKTLSGGQKRKLQMAMMFAGGSTVCCVDEVSSGVDPLSRRKLWDILLAERGRRSIILTTHFLDEADLLADRISILSKGSLKASGTSVELKHRLGSGYRVNIYHVPGSMRAPLYSNILHTDHDDVTVYFSGTSIETFRFLKRLDNDGVKNYQVNGPTLEDVFFKVAEEAIAGSSGPGDKHAQRSSSESLTPLVRGNQGRPDMLRELLDGKIISIPKQMRVLMSKRFTIFRRNPVPYLVALLIPVIAAGCSTLFLKSASVGNCNPEVAVASGGGQSMSQVAYKLVAGPQAQLSEAALQRISQAPPGAVTFVETLDQFNMEVERQFGNLTPGGFFLGDEPTFAWRGDGPLLFAHMTQNLLDSMLLNITISSSYQVLDIPFAADISSLLLFIIYFGLSMTIYPAFLALYPTMERLRGVRGMHYSNGVRAVPLWLAYLIFDFLFVVTISALSVIVFRATTDIWYSIEYLFLIFLLYGIASALYSYVVSLFATSQLATFAITVASQAAMFLVYFIVFMVVFTYVDTSSQISMLNISYYTLGIVSPVCSLSRALYLTLNVFGVACRDRKIASYPGAIDIFGGPILYLILQSLILFGILFWKESGSTLRLWPKEKVIGVEDRDAIELEAPIEFAGVTRSSDGLRVLRLRKQFKKHVAVDDITFGIPRSECFALIGPNGAGKSTCISMIRGDTQPSSRGSEIFVEGISAMKHRAKARSKLGVCPQIDPLDAMTVAEHLRFYAEIRGISDPSHNIQAIMKAVGLEQYANRIATKLSGGNKRKLSLGIALMGNPSVLLLDEPSSGMDAASKRIMWRTLASVTPGRSLLLTTHSMEEADALASRAGIVAGRMLALGTTEELRSRYGNAHFVHLVHRQAPHTHATDMERIKSWVEREFPEARVEERTYYGQVRFEIPLQEAGETSSLADIFGKLEAGKTTLDVQYYSVSTATLDQIFLAVVGKHFIEEEEH